MSIVYVTMGHFFSKRLRNEHGPYAASHEKLLFFTITKDSPAKMESRMDRNLFLNFS